MRRQILVSVRNNRLRLWKGDKFADIDVLWTVSIIILAKVINWILNYFR
jgi:hypothetical protein